MWNVKRVSISTTTKFKVLQKIEKGKLAKKSVAEEYGVKKNTVSTRIAKKKKKNLWGIWIRLGELEVWNSPVTKSSYETELHKMTSHFQLLTRKFLQKFFFWVTNLTPQNIKLNFESLTRRLNFYFSTFELLTWSWKIKSFTLSYWLEVEK